MYYLRSGLCSLFLLACSLLAAQSPKEFLGYELGDQFTPHHQLVQYYQLLAKMAPQTMRLQQYGSTNEGRPLYLAFFSAPENLANLDQIRTQNLRLAGMLEGNIDPAKAIPIVWLSMSVHGNEPSGSECSLELAYRLATQNDTNIKEWLKNTLVIVDPAVNPDGYDRYTHWNRGVANLKTTTNPDSREHREPWPGGRVNHYYFDLNRDWAWATQVESRLRILQYQQWLPQVHADLHEQGIDNPYYFAPAAEPMHDYITPWQREFQSTIGQNHARYFDANGWMYFTKEVFDLFYPSYGDTYPMYNGAIGMTYEQAGNSAGGVAITISNGDTLTLRDRIAHHLTTSLSTIEVTSKNAAKVIENYRNFYVKTAAQPQGAYKAFIIKESNAPNKINDLCKWLDLHKIKYGRVGATLNNVKAFDYIAGKEGNYNIQPNDLVISAYQPKSTFLQILFEPESRLSDSLTYDITAWSVPHAYGLDALALKERLDPKKKFEPYQAPQVMLAASPYTWCIHRKSLAEAKFLSEILQKGLKVRYATKPFAMADQQYDAGALVINRGDNRILAAELDAIVKKAAANHNVALNPVFSGLAGKGNDLGSDAFRLIEAPQIAMVYGDEVDENAFGHTWYFFERELEYPIAQIPISRLGRINLNSFNTLIFPNGYFNLSDGDLKIIQDWVRLGGRLIAFDGGARAFADKDDWALKSKASVAKDSAALKPKPYSNRERESISDQLPGAVIKTKNDASHPLGYALGDTYFTLKTTSDAFEMPEKATSVIYLDDDYQSYGFIGSRVKPRLKKTPVACVQRMGSGEAVFLVDNPMFRCFWQQGKVLFTNALFF